MTQPLEILEQMKAALDDAYAAGVRNTKREWVGLTDEEIWDLHIKMSVALNCKLSELIELARATEAKLKEKNT